MGLIKGLTKKILNTGSNKNDVKIAKLELEKAKIRKETQNEINFVEKEKIREKEKTNVIDGYLKLSKNNFVSIQKVILTLKSDIEMTKAKIQSTEDARLTLKEKSQLKKEKDSCKEELKYLYLSKDFLVFLLKYASGIDLNEEQYSLVVKFANYFDGVQVLEIEEYGEEYGDEEDDDESVVGMFKEVTQEFKSIFYKPKSSSNTSEPKKATKFYFFDYLEKYYDKKISDLEIPEVDSVIETFKSSIVSINGSNKLINDQIDSSQNSKECPNCHTKVSANVKFCSECGNKIEISKPMYCEECGSSLKAGTKFCSDCGHKVF